MKTYNVTLIGKTPLLMHQDNIEWADFMERWQTDAANAKVSKKGDDRTPPWRWLGCVYNDDTSVGMPQANIMRCLMEGGAMVPVPGGKSGKTFKSQTQSGMMSGEPQWSLAINGKPMPLWSDFTALKDEQNFGKHVAATRAMGFSLLVKRAKVGSSKHIRVRPQFSNWEARGTLAVWDEQLDDRALTQILEYAGRYKGLGDWRPGGKTPGPYGTFEARLS